MRFIDERAGPDGERDARGACGWKAVIVPFRLGDRDRGGVMTRRQFTQPVRNAAMARMREFRSADLPGVAR
jgi:hypothetical protein